MKPEDKASSDSFADAIITYKKAGSDALLTSEAEGEAKPEDAPVAAETQQCPNCDLLQPKEELNELELYCECSRPIIVKNGIPVTPEQVLAQYNSRPAILDTNRGRPVYTAPVQANINAGRPAYAAPVQIVANPGHSVYTTPRTCNCRRPGR